MLTTLARRRGALSAANWLTAVALVLTIMTPLTLAASSSSQAAMNYRECHKSLSPGSSNGINNGDFEAGNFSGWATAGSPIVTGNASMVYRGSDSAVINNHQDSFYQPLNYTISRYSVFEFAMFAAVALSDTDWHEIELTVTKQGLATIRLHYVLRSTPPSDNATDKFFYLPMYFERWLAEDRPLINDLIEKGINQYESGAVSNITCQEGGFCATAYDELSLREYDPLSGPTPNAIVNGGFEFQNFTGWTRVGTYPYVTIIDYNMSQVYEGFFSALNHHTYESFYQSLDFAIFNDTKFSAAMLATVSVSDSGWHEIMLTVDEAGLGTAYLHYRLQTNQPQDTATSKYFLIGSSLERWYVFQRNICDDLIAKGLSANSGWKITQVTCQQSGSCTVYDDLRLWGSSGLVGGGGGGSSGEGGSLGIYVPVVIPIVVLVLVFMSVLVMRKKPEGEFHENESTDFPGESDQARPYETRGSERPSKIGSPVTCVECGAPVRCPGAAYCFNCGVSLRENSDRTSVQAMQGKGRIERGICVVCGIRVAESDETLRCPYCGSVAHKDHMLEWIHVKDSCPICGRHLNGADLGN
jgi:hypothetical protein